MIVSAAQRTASSTGSPARAPPKTAHQLQGARASELERLRHARVAGRSDGRVLVARRRLLQLIDPASGTTRTFLSLACPSTRPKCNTSSTTLYAVSQDGKRVLCRHPTGARSPTGDRALVRTIDTGEVSNCRGRSGTGRTSTSRKPCGTSHAGRNESTRQREVWGSRPSKIRSGKRESGSPPVR